VAVLLSNRTGVKLVEFLKYGTNNIPQEVTVY
jgi:hypothetical protein